MCTYDSLSVYTPSRVDTCQWKFVSFLCLSRNVERNKLGSTPTSHFDWRVGWKIEWQMALVTMACTLCPCVRKADASLQRMKR